jgi:hypothetical protein
MQIKLCCLLSLETRYEVKTQFECHAAYKANHIIRNSMKFLRRCFEKQGSYMKKMFKTHSNFYISLHI